MATTTARLGLPAPALTDAADIAQAVKPLADALDAIALAYAVGTLALRPAAAAANGRVYYATDVGIMAFSDGANWQRLDLDALNRIVAIEAITPVGTADTRLGAPGDLVWSAAAVRAGSLLADGASYLRATWPALFAALGGAASPWGLPDGTHFNVPNLLGKVPLMAGAGAGLTVRALAASGGEESHLLSAVESGLPAHGTQSSGEHTHAVDVGLIPRFSSLSGGGPYVDWGDSIGSEGRNTGGVSSLHSHAVSAAPAANAHNNMPPFVAINCFVKT